jgi:glycosyltransferase involved in cell wall biosynthesis
MVVRKVTNAKLVIVGEGPTKKNVLRLVDSFKLNDSVILAGKVNDEELPIYYAASDLIVLPSLMEGFGIVLLEAMASGKPCITTKVGGTEDVVVNNKTGLIVPPRVLENFTPEKIAIQTVNLYKEFLQK